MTSDCKGNILVVDDTPANLRLLVDMLTARGYKVRPVLNATLAVSGARALPPDLILLDIMMPEMNGYEVCEQLKADPITRDVPVIFISALDDVFDKVKAFTVGGVDYVTKPFQVEEVVARLENHLKLRFLQKELENKNHELTDTLEDLRTTQNQLIQAEKIAALGQLIAGIAHEVNTPLAAIRSSVQNIAEFLDKDISQLPQLFQDLSKEQQGYIFTLLQQSSSLAKFSLTSKEKRQYKKALIRALQENNIEKDETIADILVDLGIYNNIEVWLPLLKDAKNLDILQAAYQLDSLKKSTETITLATERAAKVVYALKSYARHDAATKKVFANITEGIETVLTLYQNQLKQGVETSKNYDMDLPFILCYPDELNQVWMNLIHNALQAMSNKGTLKIDVRVEQKNVRVTITDSGIGIPAEIMPRIFEPFFTTKPTGEGSGLGLDIVKKIVEKHNGKITVESQPGDTKFTVFLPIDLA